MYFCVIIIQSFHDFINALKLCVRVLNINNHVLHNFTNTGLPNTVLIEPRQDNIVGFKKVRSQIIKDMNDTNHLTVSLDKLTINCPS